MSVLRQFINDYEDLHKQRAEGLIVDPEFEVRVGDLLWHLNILTQEPAPEPFFTRSETLHVRRAVANVLQPTSDRRWSPMCPIGDQREALARAYHKLGNAS